MIGRHYTEYACGEGELEHRHVMRSHFPNDQRLTRFPLPRNVAETHADSLNQNDVDDIRDYGDVQA